MTGLKRLKMGTQQEPEKFGAFKSRYTIFGARLKKAREAAGLTQKEISKRMSTAPNWCNRYERGERGAGIATLVKVADILGVSLDWLAGRVDGGKYNEPFKRRN